MNKNDMKNFWKNPFVLLCILGVGYWLYLYHLEHALGFLPYGILLLCPLMHIFMHGNHGHADHNHSKNSQHSTQKEKQDAR